MKLHELFEGRVKDLAYNREYDRQHGQQTLPTIKRIVPQYYVSINGKRWKDFDSEKSAMTAATTLHNRNPRLRVDVLPIK